MPANLTPQYLEAERAFKDATSPAEKVTALENMLAVIPKHKGTEKMIGELRRKLAKLKSEQQGGHKGAARGAPVHQVEKEGAGQVALAGAPNTGKSSLLRALTHATPEVADYPFTTRLPVPGMMEFEDVQIQLVDLPPLDPQHGEAWVTQTIRNADAVLLVADLGAADLLDEIEISVAQLEKAKISLGPPGTVAPYGFVVKPALVVANKLDMPTGHEDLQVFIELLAGRFPAIGVSAQSGEGLDALRRSIFELLGLVRVYTKEPGKKADLRAPYVLRAGATVETLAGRVHKEILAHLKHARIWSRSGAPGHVAFDGQMVHRDHVLADGDIVELHS